VSHDSLESKKPILIPKKTAEISKRYLAMALTRNRLETYSYSLSRTKRKVFLALMRGALVILYYKIPRICISAPLISDIVQIIKSSSIIFSVLRQARFERGLDNQNPTTMKPKIIAAVPKIA